MVIPLPLVEFLTISLPRTKASVLADEAVNRPVNDFSVVSVRMKVPLDHRDADDDGEAR